MYKKYLVLVVGVFVLHSTPKKDLKRISTYLRYYHSIEKLNDDNPDLFQSFARHLKHNSELSTQDKESLEKLGFFTEPVKIIILASLKYDTEKKRFTVEFPVKVSEK